MLTGQTPFRGDTAIETMEMHVCKHPPLLQSVCSSAEFPEELEGIVAKCLAKKPEDRFQSAEELSEALEKFQDAYQEFLAEQQRAKTAVEDVDEDAVLEEKRRRKSIAIIIAASFLLTTAAATGLYCINLFSTDPHVDTLKVGDVGRAKRTKFKDFADSASDQVFLFDIKRYRKHPREVLIRYQAGDSRLTEEKLKLLVPLPIETLEIYNSHLPKNGLSIIAEIKTLTSLKLLGDTNVNDTTLKNLTRLPYLKELSLSDSKEVTGSALSDFRNMSLTRINLRKCPMLEAKNLAALSKWKMLDSLDLQENIITPEHLKALRKAPNLKVLLLSGSRFQPGTLNVLRELPALENLSFAYSPITDDDLDAIADVKGLKAIDISGCPLSTRAISRFKQRFPNMVFQESAPQGRNGKALTRWVPEL